MTAIVPTDKGMQSRTLACVPDLTPAQHVSYVQPMAKRKPYTPWHPLFVAMVQYVYRHRYTVHGEYQLTSWPLRADVVLIEKEDLAGPLPRVPAIGRRLGPRYTLLELKGPTDDLEGLDLPMLISYAGLLEVKERVANPSDIHLMVIASALGSAFRRRVEQAGGHLVQQDRGQFLVDGLMYPLYCIESGPASETAGNGLLYAFSREYLRDPKKVCERLSGDERDLYNELCHHIQQIRESEDLMAMKDAELFERTTDKVLFDIVAKMPAKMRVQGLTIEERVQGLTIEERMQGLTIEERMQGLTIEERMQGLTAEECLQGLSEEEIERLQDYLAQLKNRRH